MSGASLRDHEHVRVHLNAPLEMNHTFAVIVKTPEDTSLCLMC